MDTTAIKAPVPAVATGRVNPILKREYDQHHQRRGGSATTDGPASGTRNSSSSAGGGALPSSSAAARGSRAAAADDEQSMPGREGRHLTWDEHAIEEHDLLRGTRMKIDEPDTPFTHYEHSHSQSDDESASSGRHPRSPDEGRPGGAAAAPSIAAQWDDVSSKLQAVADVRDACPISPAPSRESNMSDASDDETRRHGEGERDGKFKDLRKKHYNEAEMVRRWKAEHANDDDDDDDDDDSDDAMEE